jgi:hypothetical protein
MAPIPLQYLLFLNKIIHSLINFGFSPTPFDREPQNEQEVKYLKDLHKKCKPFISF